MNKVVLFDVDILDEYGPVNREIEEVKARYGSHRYGHYVFDYPFIISHLDPPPAKIVDFGCGFGTLDFYLAEQGYEIWAIDRDDTRWFMERHPNIHFIHADLPGELRIEDECWDYVIAASSIEHNSRGVLKGIVKLGMQMLRPGGKFIATLMAHKIAEQVLGNLCVLDAQAIEEVFGLEADFSQYDVLFEKFSKQFNYLYLPFGVVIEK